MQNDQELFKQAMVDFNQNNFQTSTAAFTKLLDKKFEPSKCHYYIGLIHAKQKAFDDALRHFIKSTELDPANAQAHFFAGEMYEKAGNRDLAIYYYHKAQALKPDHPHAGNSIKRLSNFQPNTPQHNHTPKEEPPVMGDLYDQLRASKDPYSVAATKMIEDTKIVDKKPITSAYMQTFFLLGCIAPLLFVLIAFILVSLNSSETYRDNRDRPDFLQFFNSDSGLIFLICFCITIPAIIIFLKWKSVQVMRITIDRGYIKTTRGLFTSETKIYSIHLLKDFTVSQDFFNKGRNDGALVFTDPVTAGEKSRGKVIIKGLAKYPELMVLAEKLRSLHYQLRSSNIIRSGIFG